MPFVDEKSPPNSMNLKIAGLFLTQCKSRLWTLALAIGLTCSAILSFAQASGLSASSVSAQASQTERRAKYSRGLLWKIESPGREASYLFGTMHSADPRVTNVHQSVRDALNNASSFTMELLFNGANISSMAEAMFFAKDQSLRAAVGDELFEQTKQAMAEHGFPTRGLDSKKPWVVIMMLNTPPAEPGLALDLLLQLEATLQGKPTFGLETIEEQIGVFNDMSMEDQVTLLRHAVRIHGEITREFERLVEIYRDGDLNRLVELVRGYKDEEGGAYDAMLERLLTRRNRVMVERMAPRLQEGNAFIAVGAAHLPGENGLLDLLDRAGYRVSAVY
ncbi:MAG: TraB/GumN family protein [Gammaproteobacteria bacterium]|nr:TraB/GumN family protein [Gammaproteobacteria bacterium]